MSEQASGEFKIREEISRLDRERAEMGKFIAEQRKLTAEANKLSEEQFKLGAEQAKLYAEAFKLDRDRRLSPWLAAGALGGGIVAAVQVLLRLVDLSRH